jgi:diaminohydroxyphosphoribosylaminopyrimidine deaminase/5-amino-6-(5-phosphoribosylamino)uracil reductase
MKSTLNDRALMRRALRLARRGLGTVSPNPMVGALLVKSGRVLGRGWHQRAGQPHAEIEAFRDAERQGNVVRGATLYVTLEPCSTFGRTPPCTEAIIRSGVERVVVAAMDPNPNHAGKGFDLLREKGLKVTTGILAEEASELNEAFNHWIVQRTPFVTVKAAMTLDGKIANSNGESKWITGEAARARGMQLRQGTDAILVGINTILADNPSLTVRNASGQPEEPGRLRRIVLDSQARTPLWSSVVSDSFASLTTIVATESASKRRVNALRKSATVLIAPGQGRIELPWLLKWLGSQNVTSLLVEGGGEVNAAFLFSRQANRVAFFYAPKILGGWNSMKAVSGSGVERLAEALRLSKIRWSQLGQDLFLEADVA